VVIGEDEEEITPMNEADAAAAASA